MHWKSCLFLLLSCFALMAQPGEIKVSDPMVGSWVGVLTHPGGYRSAYVFHLDIKKTDVGYKCWSMVKVDDIYAEMLMTGTSFDNALLKLEDKEILTHDIQQGCLLYTSPSPRD